VKNDIWSMLNESEQALLREIEPRTLRKLDEDELVAVHQRVRRARNKYAKNYRRGAAAQVAKDGGRGKVSARYSRTARKAEAFEDALARVSARLAKVAQESADRLKAERLAAARRQKGAPAKRASRPSSITSDATEKKQRRTPAGKRASAQARASNKRHQAKNAGKKR
jgi:hypothetical protein